MIKEVDGNILDAKVEALVNTVNTVGVMGKGVALQFKQAFPENYRAYKQACDHGDVHLGRMFVYDMGKLDPPRYIINFPTKGHWRSRSRLSDIEQGLANLARVLQEYEISSVAVPALGCGNGGLRWGTVRPIIIEALSELEGIEILLYPPTGAPEAKQMRVATKPPSITRGRAALIELMRRYMHTVEIENFVAPQGVSLLEIQKLSYFLQISGEDLRLNFTRAKYGPYAENLNHVLQRIEGHYLRGYGDRSDLVLELHPIDILPGAIEVALDWLNENGADLTEHFIRIDKLLEGFASPYGLELLSTVHWVVLNSTEEQLPTSEAVITQVQEWSRRKKELFTPKHIVNAYKRLADQGWFNETSRLPLR
ncbi:type II toxin-antitoxin system antitoxin DNA ADP-ribosyl glycohydrolase DarG [Actinomadura litoris]|uniref:type II toxin-antitoxin system antitoxin DNA ADP-ribosyl glycohydrolase DarG n=1 Tax=Actinomadura litoris TaxID=2678616 RepID=UPI001FA74CE5|nr:macro domain-containing protein [Actinomadura litoris]